MWSMALYETVTKLNRMVLCCYSRLKTRMIGLLLIGRMLCLRATQDTFATVRSTMALKLEADGWITIVTKSTR